MKAIIVDVDDKVIVKSMKKVFMEEIDEIEEELKTLYAKYNINHSRELELILKKDTVDDNTKADLEKIKELEEELEKLNSYLREVNMKTI